MNAATLNRAKGLTRLAVIIGLIIAGFSFFANQSAQATASTTKVSFQYITVGAGDTLWSIAAKYAPNADRRDTVDAIITLNNLQTATLQPGQRIALPNN
jgi:LysM repeat protein